MFDLLWPPYFSSLVRDNGPQCYPTECGGRDGHKCPLCGAGIGEAKKYEHVLDHCPKTSELRKEMEMEKPSHHLNTRRDDVIRRVAWMGQKIRVMVEGEGSTPLGENARDEEGDHFV